jgi:hypothetical protein
MKTTGQVLVIMTTVIALLVSADTPHNDDQAEPNHRPQPLSRSRCWLVENPSKRVLSRRWEQGER